MASNHQSDTLSVEEAVNRYLDSRREDLSPESVEGYRYQLGHFVRFADQCEIEKADEISGKTIEDYKLWRRKNGDIKTVTLATQLRNLRVFLEYLVRLDEVDTAVPENLKIPKSDKGENVRKSHLSPEKAESVLEYYQINEYASFDHALFLLMWRTGARVGAIHGLDVNDIDGDRDQIYIRHRPDQGTRLKNKYDGERIVTLPKETIAKIEAYIESVRIEVKDDLGRSPLFTSQHGRMHKRTLTKHLYFVTTPCHYGEQCPEGREPSSCELEGSHRGAVKCPFSTRSHDIRRGAITEWLRRGVPKEVISERMNVSRKILNKHYDVRSEQQKANQRRDWLDDV